MKHPFPAGLAAIASDAETALEYARLIGAPFPEGEPAIARSAHISVRYVKHLLDLPIDASFEAVSDLENLDARR